MVGKYLRTNSNVGRTSVEDVGVEPSFDLHLYDPLPKAIPIPVVFILWSANVPETGKAAERKFDTTSELEPLPSAVRSA